MMSPTREKLLSKFFLYHYLSACDCMIGKVIRQTINFARSMHYLTCYNVKGSLGLLAAWGERKKKSGPRGV